MKVLMILVTAAVILAAAAAFEIYREVHSFTVTRYNVTSPRLKGLRRETKVLFLSDLHNRIYGKHNERPEGKAGPDPDRRRYACRQTG